MAAFIPLAASVLQPISDIVGKFIPDKAANDKAKNDLAAMMVKGEIDKELAQIQTNIAEAQNPHWFVAAARPAIMWVCALGLFWAIIGQPVTVTMLVVFHSRFDPSLLPHMDLPTIIGLITSILGLGTQRTIEKLNDKDTTGFRS